MKTYKTNRLILRMFAVMLFITASPSAFGQEIIRTMNDYYICDTSIIRTKGNDTVLIYNRNNVSTFSLVCNGMTIAHTWFIEPVYVNDFEIIDRKMVYFCGYTEEEGVKKAAYGYFPLYTFLNDSTFYFSVLDTCSELTKLDYFNVNTGMISPDREAHVIMTGKRGNRSSVIADWVPFTTILPSPGVPSPSNTCDVYFSDDEDLNFDDVAVTDNYVIVSSRCVKSGLTNIDFWQFVRPTIIGYPIFNYSIQHIRVGSPSAETQVILEHTQLDSYLAGYKNFGYSRMTLLHLNAPNGSVNTLDIFGDEYQTLIPIDIKYHKARNVVDVLARNKDYRDIPDRSYVAMQIYHVNYNVFNSYATSGNGTRYFDNYLWSIDPTLSSNFFVASGGQLEIACFFRYNFCQWKSCPTYFEYLCETGKTERTIDSSHVNHLRYVLELKTKKARKTSAIPFPVICAG